MNGFVVVGIIGGVLAVPFLALWAYLAVDDYGGPGWFGPVFVLFLLVVAPAMVVIWAKAAKAAAARRAEAQRQADRERWLLQYPAEARPMVDRLEDQFQASLAWSAIGLGRVPDPARYGVGDPGEAPRLVEVRESPAGVEIDVAPQWGVNMTHFQRAAGQLAWALGAPEVRIIGGDPHRGLITLEALFRDPVAAVVKAPRPEEPVDLYALRLGLRANGTPWREPLMERNWLVAGSMGSGKSGVMRSMVLATAPAARDGYVRNVGIDLKFGIEMRQMKGLVHEVATTPAEARAKLERMLAVVQERGEQMEAAGVDKHTPTPDAPLWNLIIDELAELLDDPEARTKVLSLMRHIMRPGRALGVSVTAFTQSPEKENIASVRNLFQIRIGLRLTEEAMLQMLYGGDAKERGAGNTMLADQGTQGIAFVAAEGGRDIERVRAYYVPGEMLEAAAAMYPIYRNPKLEPSKALPATPDSNTPAINEDQAPAAPDAASAPREPRSSLLLPPAMPQVGQRRTVIPFDRTARTDRSDGDTPTDPAGKDQGTGTE
jgi:S-DNA-T family DNA segregation ATPase FtsK/SpoIIIE